MPAARSSRRRKSSHAIFTPAQPGIYGVKPRPVTFAPNVTPVSYVAPEPELTLDLSGGEQPAAPSSSIFPPSTTPLPPPARKRCPPGKRRSQGYIPRPANAYILFRADFVRQKHVPGTVDTSHGSLSTIIGNVWKQIGCEEKDYWENKAKEAKALHKKMYPDYKFRPVHNGAKPKKEKRLTSAEDDRRCEAVAQLLLDGKKGEVLAEAVRELDRVREESQFDAIASARSSYSGEMMMPMPMSYMNMGNNDMPMSEYHRRPSSAPLPNDFFGFGGASSAGITLPSLPFMSFSRSGSPVGSISKHQRNMLGHRRASSAQPLTRSWDMPLASNNGGFQVERDHSPLPDVDPSLFTDFSFGGSASSHASSSHPTPDQQQHHQQSASSSPWLPPNSLTINTNPISPHDLPPLDLDPAHWASLSMPRDYSITTPSASSASSHPSSTYSGSPAPSEGDRLPDMAYINMGMQLNHTFGSYASENHNIGVQETGMEMMMPLPKAMEQTPTAAAFGDLSDLDSWQFDAGVHQDGGFDGYFESDQEGFAYPGQDEYAH
ncbi:hypothetical protein B0H34DRAFT_771907 [Crassisporium funariophilum]|nr:hypothetical protein B0H34DRAFT_771907 [Crassisporium funariophilum]